MNRCYFLGNKNKQAYCRKKNDQACPRGFVQNCPCVPDDFWNIATVTANESKDDESAVASADAALEPITSFDSRSAGSTPKIKMPIRNISIFKE